MPRMDTSKAGLPKDDLITEENYAEFMAFLEQRNRSGRLLINQPTKEQLKSESNLPGREKSTVGGSSELKTQSELAQYKGVSSDLQYKHARQPTLLTNEFSTNRARQTGAQNLLSPQAAATNLLIPSLSSFSPTTTARSAV